MHGGGAVVTLAVYAHQLHTASNHTPTCKCNIMGGECRGRRRLGHFDTKINRVMGDSSKEHTLFACSGNALIVKISRACTNTHARAQVHM